MIEKFLRRFGYEKVSYPYDGQPNSFPQDRFAELVDQLKKVPLLKEYLDWTVSQDIKRFFSAPVDEQGMIRGAASRTRYLRTVLSGDTQLKTSRHL